MAPDFLFPPKVAPPRFFLGVFPFRRYNLGPPGVPLSTALGFPGAQAGFPLPSPRPPGNPLFFLVPRVFSPSLQGGPRKVPRWPGCLFPQPRLPANPGQIPREKAPTPCQCPRSKVFKALVPWFSLLLPKLSQRKQRTKARLVRAVGLCCKQGASGLPGLVLFCSFFPRSSSRAYNSPGTPNRPGRPA